MQSKGASLEKLLNPRFKVNCHYLIDRKGKAVQMVDDIKIAWHAGKSRWKNYKDLNKYSIGIELVNRGHEFGYQNFTGIQIKKLIKLSLVLKKKYKIDTPNILGHSDIAPMRKKDPGEKFPWELMSKKGLGIWHYKKNRKCKLSKSKKIKNIFFKNLYKIGYRYFNIAHSLKNDKLIIKAFKRKFLQRKIDSKIDHETYEISHFLAKNQKN